MLFYSQDPPSDGYAINLGNAPEALQPPEFHHTMPVEYRGFLRASYRRDPRPFQALAQRAGTDHLTLCSADRPDLVAVLYEAIVGVAKQRGWDIDGGHRA